MKPAADTLRTGARRILGRELSQSEADKLNNYRKLLMKWQTVHRLAGSDRPEWIVEHLILHSLLFLRAIPLPIAGTGEAKILDFGSGAGVPGVPLAAVLARVEVTLLESRQRRASFLSEVIRAVPLPNCRVVAERAETVVESLAGSFDAVVMRCAGDPADVVPAAKRFVASGGVLVMSGPPQSFPVLEGEWLEVEGFKPPARRRFLVIHC